MSRPIPLESLLSLKAATHDLVKACGGVERGDPRRPVSECLGRMAGRDLVDTAERRRRADVGAAAVAAMTAFGEMAADLTASLADGVVTPTEGARGDALVGRMQETLIALRAALAVARAGGDR